MALHAEKIPARLTSHIKYHGVLLNNDSETIKGYVTQIFDTDDHSNSDNNSRPTKRAPRKILPRRIAEINAQKSVIVDFSKGNIATDIHRTFGAHLFSKAFLPGYYNFLFRYKPF
ncbi:MAG: hypothetical protein EOP47_08830 [Sphingobacteriaceae bacterium]|nr:MAG: hypothetical protein EOP47_08830 [Sphingobacteriaceae bacterium]